MLSGLEFALGPTFNVVLVGTPADQDTIAMLKEIRKRYLPNLALRLWASEKSKTSPMGVAYEKIEDKTTAYVCRDQTCMPPTNSVEKMLELLGPNVVNKK